MKTRIAVFADQVNQTAEGKLNVVGVFSTISAKEFPTVHSRAFLVLQFDIDERDVGDHALLIQLRDPAKSVIHEIRGNLTWALALGGAKSVAGVQVEYVNLRFPLAGLYEARVVIDKKTVERVEILAAILK